VQRCFAFLDLCGFTAFTEREGDERTVLVLAELRATLREAAARRGVRVVKWLGDGAMLSSTTNDSLAGVVLEVRERFRAGGSGFQMRIGLAVGPVIMFEGDDYIGRSVNLASRLCDLAGEGQVLATPAVAVGVPAWVTVEPVRLDHVAGFADPIDAVELEIASAPAGETITDPVCGLTIPADTAVSVPGGASYCSVACAGIEPSTVAG